MSSISTCAKYFTLFCPILLSPNWTDLGLIWLLVGWLLLKSYGPQLSVQVQTSDKWSSSGLDVETSNHGILES